MQSYNTNLDIGVYFCICANTFLRLRIVRHKNLYNKHIYFIFACFRSSSENYSFRKKKKNELEREDSKDDKGGFMDFTNEKKS